MASSQYLLVTAESALVDLLSFSLLSSVAGDDSTLRLRRTIRDVCLKLLPQAIGLADAFSFSDWELDRCARTSIQVMYNSLIVFNSSLGRYDGRVYESLWERAQLEPLNRSEIPDGYEVCAFGPLVRW